MNLMPYTNTSPVVGFASGIFAKESLWNISHIMTAMLWYVLDVMVTITLQLRLLHNKVCVES